jgi:GNAT superfamily N-acetyltransferase
MNQTPSPQQVVCRPALERDLGDIKDFCKTIWDGHDYVPDVMDDWFHDTRGIFAVAEYEGHAIACSKVTSLARGQWWLEGFRVDPRYQGRKVGTQIHRYVDRWWVEHGDGILRLMTSSKNKSVHHLCTDTGFIRVLEMRGYQAKPLGGGPELFTPAASQQKDLASLVEFIRSSQSLAITEHLVDFGWRCVDPTHPGALSDLFSGSSSLENNFFWWRNGKGLLIVWDDFDAEKNESTMGVGVLACELEDLSALLMDVRYLAAVQSKTSVFWIAPVHEPVELALHQAGYVSDWDNTTLIFTKRHPRS